MTAIQMVAVGKLKLAEDNVREEVGDVKELSQSIKSLGVLEPLIVTDEMLVVAGSRRLAGAKQAGLKEVPVIVRTMDDRERLEVMLVENLQRADLAPMEEANGLARLRDLGFTQRQIAARIGRSQAHVAKRLSLLVLPEKVQEAVDSGGIKLEAAQQLSQLKDDPKLVEKLAKKAEASPSMSVDAEVKRELDRRERVKKANAKKAALEKSGEKNVVVLDTDQYGYAAEPPKGYVKVLAHTFSTKHVEMDPAEHAKMPCHALGIDPRNVDDLAELCTKPETHPNPQEAQKKKDDERAAKAKRTAEEWSKLTERRRGFVRGQIVGTPDKDMVLEFAFLALQGSGYWSGYDNDDIVADLLGFDAASLDDPDGPELDLLEEIAKLGAKSSADRRRATMALAVADLEAVAGQGHWHDDRLPAYYALLGRLGFEPTELEQARLEELTDQLDRGRVTGEEAVSEAVPDVIEALKAEVAKKTEEKAEAKPDPKKKA